MAASMLVALWGTGCATTPDVAATDGDGNTIEGAIVSIDTSPWMYDGNAVVVVQPMSGERVAVQLPARWNLCKAAPVDVEALRVGMRVQATGSAGADGEIVVCLQPTHRLVPAH